jgi:uncharacterized protein (DUF697 family)
MAHLFFCNHGVIELKRPTMDALRLMPEEWAVLLNGRPANVEGPDREFDALVVTPRALHVIEFKFTERPIVIRSEDRWEYGGSPMENRRRESPQKQVTATSDSLAQVLSQQLPDLMRSPRSGGPNRNLAPWVVLEKGNSANRYAGEPLPRDSYRRSGIVWILNGVDTLQARIEERELSETRRLRCDEFPRITAGQRDRLIGALGGQPLDLMIVRGQVVALEGSNKARPLPDVEVTLEINGRPHGDPIRTDQEGRFEFSDLPVDRFRVLVRSEGSNLSFVGSELREPRPGFHPITIYALEPALTKQEVTSFVEAQLETIRLDREEERRAFEQRLGQLEHEEGELQHRLSDHESRLLELMEAGAEGPEAEHHRAAIGTLRAQLVRDSALSNTDLAGYEGSAVADVRHVIEGVYKRLETAEAAAQEAADAAQRAEEYQRERARVERERREDEKRADVETAEAMRRLRESLKWSVVVGGAGGVISLQPIPFADNFILVPMQLALVMKIGRIYGKEFTGDLAFKLIATVGGGQLAQHFTILLYKLIPGAWGLGAITVPVYTILLGYLVAIYFERGRAAGRAERSRALRALRLAFRDEKIRSEIKDIGRYVAAQYRRRRRELSELEQGQRTAAVYQMLGEVGGELAARAQRLADQLLRMLQDGGSQNRDRDD